MVVWSPFIYLLIFLFLVFCFVFLCHFVYFIKTNHIRSSLEKWQRDPYGCLNAPIPAGNAQNPTRIYGRNHGNCKIGLFIFFFLFSFYFSLWPPSDILFLLSCPLLIIKQERECDKYQTQVKSLFGRQSRFLAWNNQPWFVYLPSYPPPPSPLVISSFDIPKVYNNLSTSGDVQDEFLLLYNYSANVSFTNSFGYANMGAKFKVYPATCPLSSPKSSSPSLHPLLFSCSPSNTTQKL